MRLVALSLWLSGCGDAVVTLDAATRDAVMADVATDAPLQSGCSYSEAADATNTTTAGAEQTNLSASAFDICGRVDKGHFAGEVVDVDAYRFTIGQERDVLLYLTTPTSAELAAVTNVVVRIVDSADRTVGFGRFEDVRATLRAHLPAGTYTAVVTTTNPTDLDFGVFYRLRVAEDAPLTRCPVLTGTGTFGIEQPDNDVIMWSEAATPQASFTASTTDGPHPSVLMVFPGGNYGMPGTFEDIDLADDYMDRDTWQVASGGQTNQLSLFLTSSGTSVDSDLMVFRAGTTTLVSASRETGLMGSELVTFTLAPGRTYWIWVGARDGATSLPQNYNVRLCAEKVTISP